MELYGKESTNIEQVFNKGIDRGQFPFSERYNYQQQRLSQ
jgi:hypothetical protein